MVELEKIYFIGDVTDKDDTIDQLLKVNQLILTTLVLITHGLKQLIVELTN